jgi:hypothetical protein
MEPFNVQSPALRQMPRKAARPDGVGQVGQSALFPVAIHGLIFRSQRENE